ncbi:M15 family metallopeptidase [Reichenbachiella agariperforans]|uniref:M15 family metallopeptidase n=1 Tax=Reichenbachiella agariperforans TaxID=156994 RepID=UPI001C08B5D4|nr:M15 family metallopeptidase [Reichenbachiella agariperforans]MBU2914203.1 M15 family metallopeptidase [Reichenbachiella agariperforans]
MCRVDIAKGFWVMVMSLILSLSMSVSAQLPNGFVYVQTLDSTIMLDLRYYSTNNFVGDTIDGYEAPVLILSQKAGEALAQVQQDLNGRGYGLIVYDGYRPQRAVNHFSRWASDLSDRRMKSVFYPHVQKSRLFQLGYIAHRSGHSRGSSVDLSLIDLHTKRPLDMGSPFDMFDVRSHHEAMVSKTQLANRELLKATMREYGFRHYRKEWWHYTLNQEPFPDQYFDFPVR